LSSTRPNACRRSWSSRHGAAPPEHSAIRGGQRAAAHPARLGLWVVCLLAGFLTGCAYFNTFYHARRFYNKAEQVQRDSKSDKLAPEAVRNYDKAIEKAGKVIFEHGGGWKAGIDDALFLQGQCYYGKREFETAIKKFNEVVLNFPDSEHVPEALFYTGMCYHSVRNYPTARRLFERVLRAYPDFDRRDEIMLTVAQGLDAAGNTQQALGEYRRLIERFERSDKRVDALKRIGQIHYDAGRFDSALVAYAELAEVARDDDVYFEAQLNAGVCLVRMNEPERALSIYRRIEPDDRHGENAGRVALAMAEAENRRGEHESAAELLARVSQDFVNRTLGIEADFRLGYTHEVYQQRYDLARGAYEKAARAQTQSVFKDQAARRLSNLKHLEELQASADTLSAGLDRRAAAALQVAEFSYFESDDRDQALGQYLLVEQEFPGSDFAARATYARAWILQSDFDSSAAAAAVYDSLVARYPASPQAQRALAHLRGLGHPEARVLALEALSRSARDRQRLVDDSLAAVQARADSVAALAASAAEAAARARADSLARVQRTGARSRVAFEAAAQATAALQEAEAVSAAETARLDSLAAAWRTPAEVAPEAVGDSSALIAAPALQPPDPAQVEVLLAPERTAAAARVAAARARADSLRTWAEAIIDSVAQTQAEQETRRAAIAAAPPDSVARARAHADSLAEILAAERRAARALRAADQQAAGVAAEEDSTAVPAAEADSTKVPAADSSRLAEPLLAPPPDPSTPEPEKP